MADTLRKMLVDGLQVETTDAGAAAIEKLQGDKTKLVSDHAVVVAAKDAEIAAKDAELAKKDAEIDALKGQVLDTAALDKRVQERADLIAKVAVIAKDVKTEGLSDADIRKAVVIAKRGDAVKDKPEAYMDAAFDILVDSYKTADGFAAIAQGGFKDNAPQGRAAIDAAREKMLADTANAWKGAA